MRKRTVLCLLVCVGILFFLFAVVVYAGDKNKTNYVYSLIGISNDEVVADSHFLGMSRSCQETFGPNARMCTVKEAILSPDLTSLSLDDFNEDDMAWVHPDDVDYSITLYSTDPHQVMIMVHSSTVSSLRIYQAQQEPFRHTPALDCVGWTTASLGEYGAVYSVNGSFELTTCSSSLSNPHPVLCCAPAQ